MNGKSELNPTQGFCIIDQHTYVQNPHNFVIFVGIIVIIFFNKPNMPQDFFFFFYIFFK